MESAKTVGGVGAAVQISKSTEVRTSRSLRPRSLVRRGKSGRVARRSMVWRAWVLSTVLGTGCAAVYPVIDTPVRPAPPDATLEPPPPESFLFLALKSGLVPERTRGGKAWDALGSGAPDPYV